MPELVHRTDADGVATLTFDSPHNRNALSSQLAGELAGHLRNAGGDAAIRAVVLTHDGTTFCAGADLKEQVSEGGPEAGTRRMIDLLRQIMELPKPVIARLNGHVRAGGLGLVGAADIAVAGPAATFAFTEVRLGLTPAMISITTAPRMRPRDAARYYLTGETFGPQQALDSGLITVIGEDVDEALAPILTALAACSPQGLAETKQLLSRNLLVDFDDDAALMQQWSARLFASEEAREGMQAFLERRPPRWVAP